MREGREAAARKAFVEHGGQQPTVDDARVATQVLAKVRYADERLATVLGEHERRHDDTPWPKQQPGSQRVAAQRLGHLEMRPRCCEAGPGAQLGDDWV